MSRIGKLAINIPNDVDISYSDSEIFVKGKFGNLELMLPKAINILREDNRINITLKERTQSSKALYGLYRTLISNMIYGVSKQFEVTLILKGVGYRAIVQNNEIILSLGYSHPVIIQIPEKITVEVTQNTTIHLKSCDKELLGLFASNVRSWRRPEPYKGKGILYKNEQIIRKAGKSGK